MVIDCKENDNNVINHYNISHFSTQFRGSVVADQVFPYPDDIMTAEQRETLEMLVSPTQKFFEEKNDPAKNDENAKVADDTMQGAFYEYGKNKAYLFPI